MHELEMEYIQVLNTNSDTNSDSELQNHHPNFTGKYTKPSKAKNQILRLPADKEPPLETLDSNFTSFGPSNPSTERHSKIVGKKALNPQPPARDASSQDKQPTGGKLSKIKSDPRLRINANLAHKQQRSALRSAKGKSYNQFASPKNATEVAKQESEVHKAKSGILYNRHQPSLLQ